MRLHAPARTRRLWAAALLTMAFPLGAQSPGEAGAPAAAATAMPDSVRGYVSDAMAKFRARSIHRDRVDWAALEASVLVRAENATTPAGTWQALNWALRTVDPHSFLMAPQKARGRTAPGNGASQSLPAPPMPAGRLLAGGIGLLTVPGHAGTNRPEYVDSLHAALAILDADASCGWIVDLRENTGGNMWPMLAGVGPLLGADAVGSFDPAPRGQAWRYRNGRSWPGDSMPPAMPAGWGSAAPPPLVHAHAPVAILMGRRTASSGEMTLLAFLGRPGLRTFGDSTAGFTSANAGVPLRDGATMVVTVSYARDRLGRRHPLRVAPDELVTGDGNATLDQAVAWLRRQRSCASD